MTQLVCFTWLIKTFIVSSNPGASFTINTINHHKPICQIHSFARFAGMHKKPKRKKESLNAKKNNTQKIHHKNKIHILLSVM